MFNKKALIAALLGSLSAPHAAADAMPPTTHNVEMLERQQLLPVGAKNHKSGYVAAKSSFKQNQRKQRKASARKKAKR